MKKTLSPSKVKGLAILGTLGVLFVALSGYYMYQGFTSKTDSSAASCVSIKESCKCPNGRVVDAKYNICDSRYSQNVKCVNNEVAKNELTSRLDNYKERLNKYGEKKYQDVVRTYEKAAGSDKVLSYVECTNAGLCTKTSETNPSKVTEVTKSASEDLKDYSKLKMEYELEKNSAYAELRRINQTIATCKNDSILYESVKRQNFERQCSMVCKNQQTNTTEKRIISPVERIKSIFSK